MDDGKRKNKVQGENKKSKNDTLKATISLYLHRRQLVNAKPRNISKKSLMKQAVLDSSISRANSVLDHFVSDSDSLLVEYSIMFQRFVSWLRENVTMKNVCQDLQMLVGPLFCHFYIDIRSCGKPHEAIASSNTFYRTNIEFVDGMDYDKTIKDFFKAIQHVADDVVQNGFENGADDIPTFEVLRDKLRSCKIIHYVSEDSSKLLMKYVSSLSESHVMLLHALQLWFELRIFNKKGCKKKVKRESPKIHIPYQKPILTKTQRKQLQEEEEKELEYYTQCEKLLLDAREKRKNDIIEKEKQAKIEAENKFEFEKHLKYMEEERKKLELKREGYKKVETRIIVEKPEMPSVPEEDTIVIAEDGIKNTQIKGEITCKDDNDSKNDCRLTEENKTDRMDIEVDKPEPSICNGKQNETKSISKLQKIKNVINKVSRIPANVSNYTVSNNKNRINCGIFKSNIGLAALAEKNIMWTLPLKEDAFLNTTMPFLTYVKAVNHSKQIYCMTVCSNNTYLCTGSADKTICVYSVKHFKFLRRLWGHFSSVYSVAINDTSKYLASGSSDNTARLWNIRNGKVLRVFAAHAGPVTTLHFHPNSLYLATGSADKNVRIWNISTGTTVRLLHAAKKHIYSVAFSPTGNSIAAASDDKKIRVWDIISCKVIHEFKNKESSIKLLLWSRDGKHLCGGSFSGVIKIWELKVKDKDSIKEQKHVELVIRRRTDGIILSLDNTLGNWSCLSLAKDTAVEDI
ncbi:uncharacterized protein LOC126748512 [Anthonomus grandis grandis]|uniref:uncharacterized protein LOC126748512 n=1 Tax=Anthonomus grandis grandis TaxID=2921223 RepID=UPI002164FD98|nr:uncharacterized protein LOC126748512 [Anthonomus grandis grandis]